MKGFRTIIVNTAVATLPLVCELLAFLDVFDWRSVLPPESAGWLILLVGLLNIGLRFITTTPVGEKL
ncbi:hypothetical protein [Pararhizobium sp. IMCC21322]|uniref:hypothetical protein n=1 Tax=Pararhizobium sp. IMCC21322 TaxID=3067903 RepID=UPI002741E474|nr:hypothetical protein [Pararhizobium sp. IMCC21322]